MIPNKNLFFSFFLVSCSSNSVDQHYVYCNCDTSKISMEGNIKEGAGLKNTLDSLSKKGWVVIPFNCPDVKNKNK